MRAPSLPAAGGPATTFLEATISTGEENGACHEAEWYRDTFGELYPLLYAHRDDAAAAAEAASFAHLLGLGGPGSRVLDLACGAGRHCQALSGLGARVWGLDLSARLLADARRRACIAGRLVRGDMRRLPFRRSFDLVVNLFTSFGYFADDAANARVIGEIARVLLPGGTLLLDHVNRAALERGLIAEDERDGAGFRVRQRRRIAGDRVRKEIEIMWDDGRRRRLVEDVRLYTPGEMRTLLAGSGFTGVRFFGSFQGGALDERAERMIVVARCDG